MNMGMLSRRKGKRWEQEVAQMFREACPGDDIRRGLQFRDGAECPDVVSALFWIEAKRGKRTNIKAALKQAEEAQPKGKWLLAVTKDDHDRPVAGMYLDEFLELLAEFWALRTR